MPIRSWDIFCTVIDNFGDIGVCWRLARQLAQEHGHAVRLWVDDLTSFSRLAPEIDVTATRQRLAGVDVHTWDPKPEAPFEPVTPHDVVIEAFACHLPEPLQAAMAAVDPLAGAVICHAEPDAPPSSRDTDRTACGLDCVMCCVLHAAAVLDAPPAPTCAAPQRGCVRIAWRGRELGLIHLLARSQTQPRAPPFPV